MGNIFNEDFRDFLHTLNNHNVRYILVGGYSVILHGYSRTTGDMDIWVDRTAENYLLISKAFAEFEMSLFDMNINNFLSHPEWEVFTFGKPPSAINIIVKLKGLDFNVVYENAVLFIEDDLTIRTIHKNDLIKAKIAANRHKDQNDLENLL